MKRLALYVLICCLLAACTSALRWRQYDYVVQPGDTLYSIAWHFDLDYHTLASWNSIGPPYLIYPDEKLVLSPVSGGYNASVPGASSRQVASTHSTTPAAHESEEYTGSQVANWLWPARGHITRQFGIGRVPDKGINISGRLGEPIRATAAGRVVYSGSGLPGYGQLIIIKHNNHYLSAYAHNRKRLVSEGDEVKAGQKIATMGRGNNGEPLLHFEIRHDGDPVNPEDYLPPQG